MNDQRQNRLLMRTARWLRERYAARARDQLNGRLIPVSSMFDAYIDELKRCERLLMQAERRGFGCCQRRLCSRYDRSLQGLSQRIDHLSRNWTEPWLHIPTLRELYEELQAAELEFGGIDCQPAQHLIAVMTEDITLEGVALGSFRIAVHTGQMNSGDPSRWYFVEAMEPNRAGSNDSIVHPHVDGDQLCAGDALVPISNALRQGRLCDFFVLVRSVLGTYNPQSAYVELESWGGCSCHDCGYTMGSDDSYYCERCDNEYCDECMSICESCSTTQCRNCLTCTELSNMCVCESCLMRCSGCDRLCTIDEVEEDLCSACLEQMEDEEDPDDDNHQQENHQTSQASQEGFDYQRQTEPQAGQTVAVAAAAYPGVDAVGPGVAQAAVPVPGR